MAIGTLMLLLASPAGATLITIGTAAYGGNDYNLIYSNSSPNGSIVYLDYSKSGDTWSNQVAWASSLNNAGVITYNLNAGYSMNWGGDWRLPATIYGLSGADASLASTSEMAYLFYTELGNKGYNDTGGVPGTYGLTNVGPFANLQSSWYWTGTGYDSFRAWNFATYDGGKQPNGMVSHELGMAVRSGQLEVAPVPEPSTMLLLAVGLAGFAGLRYRRRGC